MADIQLREVWACALSEYALSTGKQLDADDVKMPKPSSTKDLLIEIDKGQKFFAGFRAKRHALFQCLAYVLKPIELLGNLVAEGVALV